MRESRKLEILWFLSINPNGYTWSELVYCFPRKTLARHLKALVKERKVERILEARKKRQKGRQPTRYIIKPGVWVMEAPAKFIGSVPFFGRRIKPWGKKEHVRLFSEEKKKADDHKAYLDHVKRRDWLKKHHPYEFEKLLKLEHEKRGRATDNELLEIIEQAGKE